MSLQKDKFAIVCAHDSANKYRAIEMKPCEKVACDMLTHIGEEPEYEPNGEKTAPDFGIGDRIGIEVRRLYQIDGTGEDHKALEETAIPLIQNTRAICRSIEKIDGESWFVHLHFTRPLPEKRATTTLIRKGLHSFIKQSQRDDSFVYTEGRIRLEFGRAKNETDYMFQLGIIVDGDSGGFVVGEMETAIRHAASEKQKKISAIRHQYQEWWLVLVNHSGFDLDQYDIDLLRSTLNCPLGWTRLFVVPRGDPGEFFEL